MTTSEESKSLEISASIKLKKIPEMRKSMKCPISDPKLSPQPRERRQRSKNTLYDDANTLSAKEMRLISLAIKNSIVDQKPQGEHGDAEEMPVFRPTAE